MTIPITAANSQNRSAISRSIHSLARHAPRPLAAVSGLRSSSPLPNAARQLARCFQPTADHQHCQQQKWRRQQCHQAAHKARPVNCRRANRPVPDHPRAALRRSRPRHGCRIDPSLGASRVVALARLASSQVASSLIEGLRPRISAALQLCRLGPAASEPPHFSSSRRRRGRGGSLAKA